MYCVLWFGVFGGAALNMQFQWLKETDECGFSDVVSTRLEDDGLHAKHNRAYTVNL